MQGNKALISYPVFDRLIPRAKWTTESIKRKASLEDTLDFLPDGVARSKWQVAKLSPMLKGKDLEETCYNIWYHLYTGIRYEKDEDGKEQIRSPRRTWWGHRGDCDDFSVFVSCILSNLKIPHLFRIAMYSEKGGYQHIYPVALTSEGNEIIIDCVLNRFNKQVPYIKKIDKHMELQFLDGIGDEYQNINGIDADDLLRGDLGQLGKGGFLKFVKKGLHALNKFNPATLLLRAGILLCMKMNILKVGGSLRYTYLTDDQAKAMHLDMKRLARMKKVREKLEKIFYGAGGEPKNLKKSILKGRGNHDKAVPLAGLGSVDMNEYTTMHSPAEILGSEIFDSELSGWGDMDTLGIEPTSDSAIAVAMTAITALSVLIKSIGSLKPKGGSSAGGAADGSGATAPDGSSDTSSTASTDNSSGATTPTDGGANNDTPATATGTATGDGSQVAGNNNRTKAPADDPNDDGTGDDSDLPATTTPPDSKDSFMTKAKNWVKANKAVAGVIGLVVVSGLAYGGYKLATKGKSKNSTTAQTVSGVPKKKRKKTAHEKHRHGKIKIKKLR